MNINFVQDEESEEDAIFVSQETGSALDFIPDPDEIYGPKNNDESEDGSDEDERSVLGECNVYKVVVVL